MRESLPEGRGRRRHDGTADGQLVTNGGRLRTRRGHKTELVASALDLAGLKASTTRRACSADLQVGRCGWPGAYAKCARMNRTFST